MRSQRKGTALRTLITLSSRSGGAQPQTCLSVGVEKVTSFSDPRITAFLSLHYERVIFEKLDLGCFAGCFD